ncbi:uncharacterized protein ARMOST_16596 [Armillaria ostoyae]|uniref:Uncharacterized protein n=1 Tax=Armillaria ostoyae TaxID=47428 RepID=A0A284RWM5_ARMOS|nr:uncharacterized protein ARMOST_16596 [Armillaria ostoyae]
MPEEDGSLRRSLHRRSSVMQYLWTIENFITSSFLHTIHSPNVNSFCASHPIALRTPNLPSRPPHPTSFKYLPVRLPIPIARVHLQFAELDRDHDVRVLQLTDPFPHG